MAATFNAGIQTATTTHRDVMNKVEQWCFLYSLGQFDPVLGGHLWVPDLGLIIQFPPGSLIMMPSCVLRHGNVSLARAFETRYSFTQYTAGALFRWVEWGCRSVKEVMGSGKPEDVELVKKMQLDAVSAGARAFAKWPTLQSLGL
jgi:hypothetical protein